MNPLEMIRKLITPLSDERNEYLKRLIEANLIPDDYLFFIKRGLASQGDLEHLVKILKDPDNKNRKKYRWAKIAMYEMGITEKIIGKTELRDALELVKQSNIEEKPHIGIQILCTHRNNPINNPIDIGKKDLYSLVRNFGTRLTCTNWKQYRCVESCPHNMKWDEGPAQKNIPIDMLYHCFIPIKVSKALIQDYCDTWKIFGFRP